MKSLPQTFDLTGKVAVITGGAGLLGEKHAEAVAEMGGLPVLLDLQGEKATTCAAKIAGSPPGVIPGLRLRYHPAGRGGSGSGPGAANLRTRGHPDQQCRQ